MDPALLLRPNRPLTEASSDNRRRNRYESKGLSITVTARVELNFCSVSL